jgi:alpha-amylase
VQWHRYAGGQSSILHADPDLYVMQQHGTEAQSGSVYVLNNLGNQGSGTSGKTKWKIRSSNRRHGMVMTLLIPDERTTDAEGNAEFPAPPRGYCVYAPV